MPKIDTHSPGWMMLTVPQRGTMPPGEMDGAKAWLVRAAFAPAALKNLTPASWRAMASRTACIKGMLLELLRFCLAARTLAMASTVMPRTPVPITDAEALVIIAMAEPVTAA
ncbi:MAG TPA: hypothetical protein VGE89_00225 [Bryobacteraceae bacterium]